MKFFQIISVLSCVAVFVTAMPQSQQGYIQKILGVLAQMEEDTDDMDDYFMDDTSDYDMDGDMSDEDIEEEAREYVCAVAPELPTCRTSVEPHDLVSMNQITRQLSPFNVPDGITVSGCGRRGRVLELSLRTIYGPVDIFYPGAFGLRVRCTRRNTRVAVEYPSGTRRLDVVFTPRGGRRGVCVRARAGVNTIECTDQFVTSFPLPIPVGPRRRITGVFNFNIAALGENQCGSIDFNPRGC